jgi:hypothetical protein
MGGSTRRKRRRRVISKDTRKRIRKSWGYVLLPLILWGWVAGTFDIPVLAGLSELVLLFLMVNADVPCGAAGQGPLVHLRRGMRPHIRRATPHVWQVALRRRVFGRASNMEVSRCRRTGMDARRTRGTRRVPRVILLLPEATESLDARPDYQESHELSAKLDI